MCSGLLMMLFILAASAPKILLTKGVYPANPIYLHSLYDLNPSSITL